VVKVKVNKNVTIEMPSEEELSKISEEEFEEGIMALDNVASFDELIDVLKEFGFNITESDDEDDLPGPNDTIH
jgi:hypothetical protein